MKNLLKKVKQQTTTSNNTYMNISISDPDKLIFFSIACF